LATVPTLRGGYPIGVRHFGVPLCQIAVDELCALPPDDKGEQRRD